MFSAELFEPFLQTPSAYAFVFVLGTLFGSFANVCIYRWPPTEEHPHGRSVVRPGSHCNACGAAIRWYDNIPIVSYLMLRGHCRRCGVSFSPRYMLVEAAMGMLFAAAYYSAVVVMEPYEPTAVRLTRFFILAAFFFVLVVIAFIDLDTQLILDKVTYPAIPLFYGLGLLLPGQDYAEGLIGAAVGYGVIRVVADGYYFLTGREGLGYGDGKLLALVGALYGWRGVVMTLFIGSLTGSVIGTAAVVLDRSRAGKGAEPAAEGGKGAAAPAAAGGRESEPAAEGGGESEPVPIRHVAVPFGPFLVFGAILYVFAQPWIEVGSAWVWER